MKIRDILHVGLLSPAAASQADFYLDVLGLQSAEEGRLARDLQPAEEGQCVRFLCAATSERPILSLHPAERRGLHHLAFRLDGREAVDAAAVELERQGITLVAQPGELAEPGGGYGLRFLDPENRCIEFSAGGTGGAAADGVAGGAGVGGMDDGAGVAGAASATGVAGATERSNDRTAEHAGPRRLCHVGLNTPQIEQIVAFYTEVLGFRVSDWIEDQMAFLRCGRRHHAIVFNRADYASVHHIAFGLANVDELMKGVSNLRARGHEAAWGPGRHGPGNNVFCYFEDPAGYVFEFSSDLASVEEETTHKPAVWSRVPETADWWGTAGAPSTEIRKAMAGDPDSGHLT